MLSLRILINTYLYTSKIKRRRNFEILNSPLNSYLRFSFSATEGVGARKWELLWLLVFVISAQAWFIDKMRRWYLKKLELHKYSKHIKRAVWTWMVFCYFWFLSHIPKTGHLRCCWAIRLIQFEPVRALLPTVRPKPNPEHFW